MLDHIFTQLVDVPPARLRDGPAPASGGRGAVPGRRLPGRRQLRDLLQPPRRGAPGPHPGRHQPRLADLEPDRVPELGHRRGARRAPRGAGGDRLPGPGPRRRSPRSTRSWPCSPTSLDVLGDDPLVRGSATIEQVLLEGPSEPECAIEVSYEGSCQLDEAVLDDPTSLDDALAPLGRCGGLGAGPASATSPSPSGPPDPADDRPADRRLHPVGPVRRTGPASTASARRSAWGRAPTWEMTSAAHTPPRRAESSGDSPLVMPVEEPGGEEVAGTGGVDHPVDRGGGHRHRTRGRHHHAIPPHPG